MNYINFPQKKTKQSGFTLVELMVAMGMGIALIAVVLTAFVSMVTGNRTGNSQQQMNEDAQAAFQILGQQIRNAGFNPLQPRADNPPYNRLNDDVLPLAASPAPQYTNAFLAGETTLGVFGCETGFSNAAGVGAASHIRNLTCNAAGGSPMLAIQYEVDQYSPNLSGTTPADCRGFAVPVKSQQTTTNPGGAAAGDIPFYIVENRYFIANGGLSCTGNGTQGVIPAFETQTQPLIGNIESMQIDYGVVRPYDLAPTVPPNINYKRYVAGYLKANAIGPATGTVTSGVASDLISAAAVAAMAAETPPIDINQASQRWALVNTVRVCLIVRSATATLTDNLTVGNGAAVFGYYSGCNPTSNAQISITDNFMRKAYTMHFTLRSRITTPQ